MVTSRAQVAKVISFFISDFLSQCAFRITIVLLIACEGQNWTSTQTIICRTLQFMKDFGRRKNRFFSSVLVSQSISDEFQRRGRRFKDTVLDTHVVRRL